MAVVPKYMVIDTMEEKIIGSADDITNAVNQWHRTGEKGVIVKTVTWKTTIEDVTDAPSNPNPAQYKLKGEK